MKRIVLLVLFTGGIANAGTVSIDLASFSPGANITSATPGITLNEVNNTDPLASYVLNPAYAVVNVTGLDAGPTLIGHNNPNPLIRRDDFRNVRDEAAPCFSEGDCSGILSTSTKFNGLLMSFQYPTNLIEFRVHKSTNDLDGTELRLYNRQKELLTTCYVPGTVALGTPAKPTYKPKFIISIPCGEMVRQYNCSSGGNWCDVEYKVRVTRGYPDIAYALWGGESYTSTHSGAINLLSFRRFSDCAP